MTDEELIARLRVQRTTDEMTTEECAGADYEYAYNMVVQDCREAADRIEALVKERFNDALHLIAAQRQAQQAEALAPTDAATQKGGDAHDRRLRSHEASPGVTAGADAAQENKNDQ